jgi:hypothetical protein
MILIQRTHVRFAKEPEVKYVERYIYPKSSNPQQLQRRFQPLMDIYPDALTILDGSDEEVDIHCRIASELVGTRLEDGGYESQARWLSERDVDRLLFRDFARHILALVENTNMRQHLGIVEGRMHHIVYACVIRFLETHRRKMRMRLLDFDGMCDECDRLRERRRKRVETNVSVLSNPPTVINHPNHGTILEFGSLQDVMQYIKGMK